jgi:hypothetical protein
MKTTDTCTLLVLLSLFFGAKAAHAYYSPTAGRWLNRDPVGELGGANTYSFIANRPAGAWDRLGLCACCECAVGLDVSDIRFLPAEGLFQPGHQFTVDIYLEYSPAAKEGSAVLKWEEKSNRPPEWLRRKGAKPNEWYDLSTIDPDTDIGMSWRKRRRTCSPPVGRIVYLFDWPRADLSLGKRVLEFRITVVNPKDCGCDRELLTVTAVQTLDPAAPDGNGGFQSPDPAQP